MFVRAIQDDTTIIGPVKHIYGKDGARSRLIKSFSERGNEPHPTKARAYGNSITERVKIPAEIQQPSFTLPDGTRAYGFEICGSPVGDDAYVDMWLNNKAKEISDHIQNIADKVTLIDPHSGNAITTFSLQHQADHIMASLPSTQTRGFAKIIDNAIQRAFSQSIGSDLLHVDETKQDPLFVAERARLKSSKGGASMRFISERPYAFNCLNKVLPLMVDTTDSTGKIIKGYFRI